MKTIRHTATLFYFDGVQVFEGRDAIEGHYIGVAVPGEGARFVVVGVTARGSSDFRAGRVDLRSLLLNRPEAEWFIGTPEGETVPLERQEGSLADSGFLPDEGFLLHDEVAADVVVSEARERNNLVLDVAVEPPEAVREHRIHANTLGAFLSSFQSLVKQAYNHALRGIDEATRRRIDTVDAHVLDVVVPAAAGSFRVVMEAAKGPDLFGSNELGRALVKIDSLIEASGNPELALERAREVRGHFAGAYLRFLRLLAQSQSGLRYNWAEPSFSQPHSRSLSKEEVAALVDVLSAVANLGTETVTLTGALRKADVGNSTWRLDTGEAEFAGRVKDGGPSLDGLQIGAKYEFRCEEIVEETQGVGRETRTLYLTEYRSV